VVYKCPELFTDILLQRSQGMCSDQHSYRGTAHARAHLIRLQNTIAGNWKTTPDGNTRALHPMPTIVKGIRELSLCFQVSPFFWHDARIALDTDRGM
jgi:hypothetical protein